MSNSLGEMAKILNVDEMMLERLEDEMGRRTGKPGVVKMIAERNAETINATLNALNSDNRSAEHVKSVLRKTILEQDKEFLETIGKMSGGTNFQKAAALAEKMAKRGKGLFLKKELAREILEKRTPENLLSYLGAKSLSEVLEKHDIAEIFSALRFTESDEWMHKTFDEAYGGFTADDFEEREIEIRVLGPEWKEISEKFVAKKHHNVSHLKEFGVIFLNPISENIPGKFLRDFALLLHYFHEIEFYSKLFRKYSEEEGFAAKFRMLLRGDVPETYKAEPGEWLIVQRYLAKINPQDPRLYLPRVNPESMHWARGERDLDIKLWHNLDWIGGIFADGKNETVSFDLEDNAMSLVSFMEGKNESFNYHQRESMWTKIFEEYAGGEAEMEKLLLENFDKGIIRF